MKEVNWKVKISGNKIMSIEHTVGLPAGEIETHLQIIGVLENLKQKHLEKLNTLFEETRKGNPKGYKSEDV